MRGAPELDDDDWDEREELAAQDRAARAYQRALIAHPDPRDPDYPGHYDEEVDEETEAEEEDEEQCPTPSPCRS